MSVDQKYPTGKRGRKLDHERTINEQRRIEAMETNPQPAVSEVPETCEILPEGAGFMATIRKGGMLVDHFLVDYNQLANMVLRDRGEPIGTDPETAREIHTALAGKADEAQPAVSEAIMSVCDNCEGQMDCRPDGRSGIKLCSKCGGVSSVDSLVKFILNSMHGVHRRRAAVLRLAELARRPVPPEMTNPNPQPAVSEAEIDQLLTDAVHEIFEGLPATSLGHLAVMARRAQQDAATIKGLREALERITTGTFPVSSFSEECKALKNIARAALATKEFAR